MNIEWSGKGEKEVGRLKENGEIVIEIDSSYYRPTEVDLLHGNPAKAKEKLGWVAKTSIEELVKIMVEADYKNLTDPDPKSPKVLW